MSDADHRRVAAQVVARCAVVTLSDTRTEANDTSGAAICRLLTEAGNHVADYRILKDEPQELAAHLSVQLARHDIDAILTTGGTGISKRDQTIGVVERLIELPLPGFGELFRTLSWEQVGSAAMLSRAVGGIARGKLLFAMPGSTKGVELAMTKLILPEIKHLVFELRK